MNDEDKKPVQKEKPKKVNTGIDWGDIKGTKSLKYKILAMNDAEAKKYASDLGLPYESKMRLVSQAAQLFDGIEG